LVFSIDLFGSQIPWISRADEFIERFPWGLAWFLDPANSKSSAIMFLRPSNLYRAFFCALGLVMIIVGLECLAIESALFSPGIFEDTAAATQQNPWLNSQPPMPQGKIFRPKDWFPWSLLAVGSIVAIYSQAVRNPSPISFKAH
jgi:hypothetical protein